MQSVEAHLCHKHSPVVFTPASYNFVRTQIRKINETAVKVMKTAPRLIRRVALRWMAASAGGAKILDMV